MQIWLLSAVAAGVGGFVLGQIWSRRGCRRCERSTEAELAHAQARRLQHQYVDAVESISEGFVLFDSTDHLVLCNSKYRDSLAPIASRLVPGITFDEIARLSAEHGLIKAALGRPEAWLQERLAEHRAPSGPVEMEMFDGRVLLSREYRTHDGGIVAIRTDITDRVRVERELKDAKDQLAAAIESITEGFALWDPEDRLVLCNSVYRDFFPPGVGAVRPGGRFEDMLRALVSHCQIPEAEGRRETWIQERLAQHRHPQGSVELNFAGDVWLLANERETEDNCIVGVYTNITALKRREAQVEEQSRLLQAIIDHMPQGISVFDRELTMVALNRNTLDLFGLPENAVRPGATTFAQFIHCLADRGEYGDSAAQEVRNRLDWSAQRGPHSFERVRPNGVVVEVRRNAMPDGGFLATYTDITERKRVEETLRHAKDEAERGNRAKAAFLAAISHELRTPLNAILGFSEAMLAELFGPIGNPRYQEYTKDVYESAGHLLNLINDILDMSKAEAGKIEIDEQVVDIAQLVESSLKLVRKRADNAKITLEVRLPETLPRLRGDHRRLKQILLNLLSNAVKFTEDCGRVTVEAYEDDNGLHLDIADTGIGMEPEDLSKVMEPFAQVDNSLSRKYEGTGLGLPLTRALVEAHGGTLTLSSVPGQGTTAAVTLPRERIAAAVAA